MKKVSFFLSLSFLPGIFAQQYTHQVLIANEGFFDFQTNSIIEPATIGSYNPITQVYFVVDTLFGQRFSSDILIDNDSYFVAADTKIFKFDLNSHQQIGSIELPGVRNLAIWGDYLIATRGEYLQAFDSYLQVFNKSNLQLIVAFDTITGPKWSTQNMIVLNDIAYVAVNNAYEWGNEKGLIGQLDLNTLAYGSEIDLGQDGKNPDNMFLYNNEIYTVNNKDWSGTSISKIDINGNVQTQNIANATTGCGTSALRDDKIVFQLSMDNILNNFNIAALNNEGPINGIVNNFYELAQDPSSGFLYTSATDFFSEGKIFVYDANNDLQNQFDVGVSPGTIVFDVRSSALINENENDTKIYPNPSSGVFSLMGGVRSNPYHIFNIAGQEILTGMEAQIDLSPFENGVYFLFDEKTCLKLIKK